MPGAARGRWGWRLRRLLAGVALLAGSDALSVTWSHAGDLGLPTASIASATPAPDPTRPGIALATAPIDLPDPLLLDEGGRYALFVSTAFGDYAHNVPVLEGRPGGAWSVVRDSLPALPAWAVPANGTNTGGLTWAPSLHRFGSTWVMYFSATVRGWDLHHCIGTATSTNPLGPFRPDPSPLVCQRAHGGDIDAEVYLDRSAPGAAKAYLIWKSDDNSLKSGSPPKDEVPSIWAQPLSGDGRRLLGRPAVIFRADRSWQHQLVEAPQLVNGPDGRLWLFYSGGYSYHSPGGYGVGVAGCAGPLGPCRSVTRGPLLTDNAQGRGVGEETVFVGRDGSAWIVYNPWSTGQSPGVLRPAEAARIGWGPAGPFVARAGAFPDPS
ncbi:family 43 glycosylhydrolase [Acidiferrimicrobium sp. IK]|uniref:family 43 glycosylhydrolase n=1 Tax=Acidiferrimicrobium sp. IK TaxID=2871700 RepID=UPI0021CB6F37|nr:family 43 glycosylhydrolase [Acidiferrimicrobium sp. IK]MCU4183160.1 family 43 glycosylhydrolase [Acidiferrimicrobium sp. IK]